MNRIVRTTSVLLALVAGCGGGTQSAFSHQFRDNYEDDFAAVLERLPAAADHESPQNALARPLAVATTNDEPRRVVALDLSNGETLWAHEIDAQTRPEILGDLVLTSDRTQLVALDLSTGNVRWTARLGDLAYVGASRDGDMIFWAATVGALGGARRVGHIAAVDARTGGERWRHEVQGVFGRPASTGGMVLVPWERQNIAVLDELTGVELARLRSTDDVVAWIFDDPTGVYYGHRGIYRLTQRSVSGTREGSTHVEVPLGDLPRDPDIYDDGFLPKPGTRSARGRIRVYFSPAPAMDPAEVRIAGDTYYFVYYRYVFAYGLDGVMRWARIVPQDIIGAQALEGGIFTVGEQGELRVLDRDSGLDRWTGGSSMDLAAVDLDVAGFAGSAPSGSVRPLRETLTEIALDPDNRLVPARAYAVETLASIEEPEITRDLLDLYAQRSMPGTLREAIATALRSRRTGPQYLIEALGRRYDFIEDTQAPPLEVIIPSLLEMHATQAVPQLVQQMNDHETPAAVLPIVVEAVAELGDASVVPALRSFLVFYHADSAFRENADALAWAARGIFNLGGPEGRDLLASIRAEGRTVAPLGTAIAGLYDAEAHQQEQLAAREAADAQAALDEAARRSESQIPSRLTQEQVNTTFAEHADDLRECVAGEVTRNPLLGQVRLVFIMSSDGSASEISVAPNTPELVTCMQQRVGAIQFPRFRQRRQRGAFTISLRGGAPQQTPGASQQSALERPLTADDPWWAWTERRAQGSEMPTAIRAWWDHRPAPVVVVAEPTTPTIPTARPTTPTTPTTPQGGGTWWGGAGEGSDAPPDQEGGGAPPEELTPPPAVPPAAPPPAAPRPGLASHTAPTPPPAAPTPPPAAPTPPPAAPTPPPAPAWWEGAGGSGGSSGGTASPPPAPAAPTPPPPTTTTRARSRLGTGVAPIAPTPPPPTTTTPPPVAPPPAAPPAPPAPPAPEAAPWWAPAGGAP